MQSYQNVSNSQLVDKLENLALRCKRLCKVIKMLAIHNEFMGTIGKLKLQTLMQSYQNVSNSQPLLLNVCRLYGCKRLCKVIKMLAIHNTVFLNSFFCQVANAYAKLSKC